LQQALFRAGAMTRAAGNGMETTGQHPITLVTACFNLGRKQVKYTGNPYPDWSRNFLPYIKWPLVIFCDEQSVDMLKEARGDKPAVWHVTRPEDFVVYKYWNLLKDLKKPYAGLSAEVSLVWHEKHNFLRRALSENPFNSEMLFWCDIGMFRFRRDAPWRSAVRMELRFCGDAEWPNLRICRELPQDRAVLLPYGNFDRPNFTGQFFGGAVKPAREWCDAYYRHLERRARKGTMIYSEEGIMESLYIKHPDMAYPLPPGIVPWLRPLAFLTRLAGKKGYGHRWYLLSGRRFPWKHICKGIFSGSGK